MSLMLTRNSSRFSHLQDQVRQSIGKLVADLKTAKARRDIYRRSVSELSGLSDRELADIGMHRSQIRRVALETSRGEI